MTYAGGRWTHHTPQMHIYMHGKDKVTEKAISQKDANTLCASSTNADDQFFKSLSLQDSGSKFITVITEDLVTSQTHFETRL